ncbi:MAG: cytochrome-c peroxidase [Saprospiraceae bacterium]|nr:cytochrome-c peroxidase [Saprospiraceae bacterium]
MAWLLAGCSAPVSSDFFPYHFPEVDIPSDNAITDTRVALGERLFFDPLLSADTSISCVHCHLPEYAFADTTALSDGVAGALGKRNAPSLFNRAYLGLINKDGGVKNLDLQALVPIEDEHEMALPVLKLQERLRNDREYQEMSMLAYGRQPDAYVVTRALASYVRTLISADAPYDRHLQGDATALGADAQAGMHLFESDRLGCCNCHAGVLLTTHDFANNGLYEQYADRGRGLITMDSSDYGKFRIPSLRNVSLTAPYMHDGSLSSLDEVIDHYAFFASRQGRDDRLRTFELTAMERQQLKAFLDSLTGSTDGAY